MRVLCFRTRTQFTPSTNNIAPANALERSFAVFVILLAMGFFSSQLGHEQIGSDALPEFQVELPWVVDKKERRPGGLFWNDVLLLFRKPFRPLIAKAQPSSPRDPDL